MSIEKPLSHHTRITTLPQVKIYTRKMCGFCSAAKRLLKSKDISFRELDATFDSRLRGEMIAEAKGGSTFPQIFIGKHHVGGCDELFALESTGKLDAMLLDKRLRG